MTGDELEAYLVTIEEQRDRRPAEAALLDEILRLRAKLDPPSSGEIVRIPIAEFRAIGFLQEANRLFFHPLGLALEVQVDDDGSERLSGLWDYRDDPEGIAFGPGVIDREKIDSVNAERDRHRAARTELLGSPWQVPEIDDAGLRP